MRDSIAPDATPLDYAKQCRASLEALFAESYVEEHTRNEAFQHLSNFIKAAHELTETVSQSDDDRIIGLDNMRADASSELHALHKIINSIGVGYAKYHEEDIQYPLFIDIKDNLEGMKNALDALFDKRIAEQPEAILWGAELATRPAYHVYDNHGNTIK